MKKILVLLLVFVMGCNAVKINETPAEEQKIIPAATSQVQEIPYSDPMENVGVLMTPEVTAVSDKVIDWPHLEKMGWKKTKCLTGVECYYMQSGVPNQSMVQKLANMDSFTVPDSYALLFGAYAAVLQLTNGYTISHTDGFYAALTNGTKIENLSITDGFVVIIDARYAQAEHCMRIAQAISSGWAYSNLYRPAEWPDCEGRIMTPLDSDR